MAKKNLANLRKVWKQSTEEEREEGKLWYLRALEDSRKLGNFYRVPTDKVVGVVAALSPNKGWKTNLDSAERVLAGWRAGKRMAELGPIPAYPNGVYKAWTILGGFTPQQVLETPRGKKVWNFYLSIGSAGEHPRAVCIDTHAYAAWDDFRHRSGKHDNMTTMPDLSRGGRYEQVAEDYRQVAKEVGLEPGKFQAVLWLTWKRMKGVRG